MKKINQLLALLFASIFFFVPTIGTASEFNFAVNPVIPENQIDKEKTYFDLKMAPGTVQTVEVQLRNDTDQEVVIAPVIASATTNLNGVVEYGENDIEADETLPYDMADLIEVEKEITIPKQSQITLPLKITMPSESFEGVIAGGLTLKETTEENATADSEEDQGLAIKNEYAYVVAILLRQNTAEVAPDLKLLDVGPGQVNSRNTINVTLQNPEAAYLNSLRLINEVKKKGDSDVLYSSDTSRMQMAPNSNFSYPISLEGQRLEAGTYVLTSVAYGGKSEEGQYKVENEEGEEESYLYKWTFEKEFTVTGDVARDLNQKDVTIETDYTWLYFLIGGLLLLLAFLLLLWYRRKKKMKRMKREHLEKYLIDGLIIAGILLLALPFLKESIVSWQLRTSELTIATQLPTTIPEEETIQIPTLGDALAPQPATITGYGFVAIEAIEFQQPLLVGITNQQLLKGGVVMFPQRLLKNSNFVVLGHHLGRQSLLFSQLLEAQVGMEVSVSYLEENQQYLIIDKKIVEETDLSVLADDQGPRLTLITCPTPTRTDERLVLTAIPVEQTTTQQSQKSSSSMPQSSDRMIEKQEKQWKQQSKKIGFFYLLFYL